jgi:hypothetical protein
MRRRVPTASRQMLINQLTGLQLYVYRKFSLRRESDTSSVYLAYGIGPEALAVTVQELDARSDEEALNQATPLFHDGLKRIEIWCGSRKVANLPPREEGISDEEPVHDSA